MGRAENRVAARRAVHEAQLERRREQATRDKELQALAVEVQVTLVDGRARLRDAEIAAGVTLNRMITELGQSTTSVVDWCCGAVTAREVARLRRLAAETAAAEV
ncbi:hypothetical protein [uncultured Friedmanniella sp.]|uniref:hypothetical protein n=1 Tax=uncultured Friedmanniella sp. TaxID=335381 RepID=UPI0035C9F929